MSEAIPPDQLSGFPHPRETDRLIGHDQPISDFLRAVAGERLHHAWILSGADGIGKATFAYLAARHLLGDGPASDAVDFGGDPDARAARLIRSAAHPNVVTLRRPTDEKTGKVKTQITVGEVRRLKHLFEETAGEGGWRIAVIDPVDDLNLAAANALLKMLEEPPARCIFFLVSSRPGRLLPTIRSRCRMLNFEPLARETIARVLADLAPTVSQVDREAHAGAADGSVRRALELSEGSGMAVQALRALLDGLPSISEGRATRIYQNLADRGADRAFSLACDLILDWTAARTRHLVMGGNARPSDLARWSELWENLAQSIDETKTYNLNRNMMLRIAVGKIAETETAMANRVSAA